MTKVLVGCGAVLVLVLAAFGIAVVLVVPTAAAGPRGASVSGTPEEYRVWTLRASGECRNPGLTPALLAAQLFEESGFRAGAVSPAGAQGPAQFMPGTWATWGRDDDHNGSASPFDVGDAVMAQGRYMCSLLGQAASSGFADDLRRLALAGYNAGWAAVEGHHGVPPYAETQRYVADILGNLSRFQAGGSLPQIAGTGAGPEALRRAATQLGVPYSYGGGSPAGPSRGHCDGDGGYRDGQCLADSTTGWDCSALVQYAYWPSRRLPRTAAEQYSATADHAVAQTALRAGDLLFWRHDDGHIYHVALYLGDGQMISAPKTGDVVKSAPVTDMPGTDYVGATRP
ncbi:NlpC/P60 family protein [Streptomyces sp. NRRL WC-3742]|uniref:C40 family peptidase n=1 Tax=Streptomyces sp. NRRL WC-3742 TaxID=1463934 RepID=UPI000D13F316|nr:bifunctional lytic transglycosylase/C40 family peptidase [Streptomyces sp. NRRL WC-3742]